MRIRKDILLIKPVSPKGNQSWIFIGKTDAEAEPPILWPSDAKSWLIRKDPDAGKHLSQEEKGMTEDEMVGWHHWLDGHECEQTLGVDDGEGSMAWYSPWGRKQSDMPGWLIDWILWMPCPFKSCEFQVPPMPNPSTCVQCIKLSETISCSVVSDSLRPHEL